MNKLFCLSNVSIEQLPADLAGQACLSAPELSSHQLPALTASYEALIGEDQAIPNIIIGSYQTPVLQWISAQRAFPDAMSLCYEGDESGVWRDLNSSDVWGVTVEEEVAETIADVAVIESAPAEKAVEAVIAVAEETKAEPKQVVTEQSTEAVTPTPAVETNTQKQPKEYRSISQYKDEQLLDSIFKLSWWDGDDYSHQVAMLMDEVLKRGVVKPKLVVKAEEKRLHGSIAKNLIQKANELIKQQFRQYKKVDVPSLHQWLSQQPNGTTGQIAAVVKRKINDSIDFYEKKKTQYQTEDFSSNRKKEQYHSQLKSPVMKAGKHPNNIRLLLPSQQWTILIDETGQHFSHDALTLGYNNNQLGRVVALAIPQRSESKLPPLHNHHATEVKDESQNDAVMQTILSTDVGVFGFTMKDSGLAIKHRWFDAISQLVRWTMLMLPINPANPTSVKFKIEQRGYDVAYPLNILAEGIESELKTINFSRFANTHIQMEFIGKDGSPFNGYVDTVAHAWGSSAAIATDRLKKSKLEGHCLLRPDTGAIERIYLAADAQKSLSAKQWYDICSILANEPESSLLHGMMDDVGRLVKNSPKEWNTYMAYVNDRLRIKDFQLKELEAALDWLSAYTPENQVLPKMAQLYWQSARLAQLNHQGKADRAHIESTLKLANSLRNESAVDACGVALRIATAVTNNFEFESAIPFMEKWKTEDVAIPGLLNHAKIHSTIGQLMAFTQRPEHSISSFDDAIRSFNQLSDKEQAKKEINHTNTYKLISMMDATVAENEFASALWAHFELAMPKKTPEQVARKFAMSGIEDKNAYGHHLLLRAFVTYPSIFKEQIKTYLSSKEQWQTDNTHPWQWINAYRAWLILLQAKSDDKKAQKEAKNWFNQAIVICINSEQGATIRWIGSVISVMAHKLCADFKNNTALTKGYFLSVQTQLPNAPFAQLQAWHEDKSAVTQESVLNALKICTPFNFH